MKKTSKTAVCQVTGRELPVHELVSGYSIRSSVLELIKKDIPGFDVSGYISREELNRYRHAYLKQLLSLHKETLTDSENTVLAKLVHKKILSKNVVSETDDQLTMGQRLADRVAQFGGSWSFVSIFFFFIITWMGINVYVLVSRPFDPYPFILLNLILSCIAAIQAPVIMMSQNRQETKDRARSEHDYQVNLKAELEIRQLQEKLDHLIMFQVQRIIENQEVQVDYLEEILGYLEKK